MIQELIIGLIFITALAYLGRLIIRSFTQKDACATGCGKCGVDFSRLEKELKGKGL